MPACAGRSVLRNIILISAVFFSLVECSYPQFVYFGRNKVQYTDFDWYVISTEHFKLYYYKEAKELAEQGAYFAEENYKSLSQKFNHSLIDTVPIIFYSSPSYFKQTNTTPGFIPDGVGGFFEFIKGRVVIPYDGSLGNFRHVLKHELVHVFMTSKIATETRIHGQLSDRLPPLWFTEGLAEYWSTHWDVQSEMALKDAVLNDYLPGLDDYENIYGTYLMYKLGQKALEYISEKFGEEKILGLIENFWAYDNFQDVMKHTIDRDYGEFDKEFLYHLKKIYYPQLKEMDFPSQTGVDVFSEGFGHKPAYYKSDKTESIFFIGNRTGYTSIYRINLSGDKSAEMVLKGEESDEFEQFHFFRSGLGVSASGLLAFVTQKGEADALHIYDIKSESVIADFSFENLVGIASPSWDKDSRRIVFSGVEKSGKCDLYIFDYKTEKLTRLMNDYYDDRDPDFSPDGKSIVFSSDRTSTGSKNNYNIFILNTETSEINYLTLGEWTDFAPKFSPDGKKIVFTSTATGVQNLWMIDISRYSELIQKGIDSAGNSVQMKMITNFTTGAYDPVWAGDNKIAFACYERGNITVRMLKGVDDIFSRSTETRIIDFRKKSDNWVTGKIYGVPRKNDLRYEKRLTFDLAATSLSADPVFGATAGGLISLSDLLGNDNYNILIYNTSDPGTEFWKSFNIAISKISLEKRLNYAYGVFHLSGKRYDLRESDYSYYERLYGGYLGLAYPLSFFKRFETSVSLAESVKDIDFINNRRSLLLSNSISYVFDNSLWSYTGPIDGQRFNFTLGYTVDVNNSNESYYSIMFDYRKYFRISRPVALAFRGQYFVNDGKFPRRFFMGGNWSLRGWSWNSIRGANMWQANAELRFPLLNLVELRFPFNLTMSFPGIRGALYFDAGNAWDSPDNYGETKGSLGAGIRMNLFGMIGIRYDFGKRIENNFRKLQDGLFHQVFFGWDF